MVLDEDTTYDIAYGPYARTPSGDRMFVVRYHIPRTTLPPTSTAALTATESTAHLMTINTATGVFTETGPITPLIKLGFDPTINQVFGVTQAQDCAVGKCNYFVHLDAATGTVTVLANVNTTGAMYYGLAHATDPDGHRVFLQQWDSRQGDDGMRLLTIDTHTGTFITSTAPISPLIHLGYDRTTMSTVGVSSCPLLSAAGMCNSIVRIDPITGGQTVLNELNPDRTAAFGSAYATDGERQRMFVQRYEPDNSPDPYLVTIDMTTGVFTRTAQPLAQGLISLGYSPIPLPATLRTSTSISDQLYLPQIMR